MNTAPRVFPAKRPLPVSSDDTGFSATVSACNPRRSFSDHEYRHNYFANILRLRAKAAAASSVLSGKSASLILRLTPDSRPCRSALKLPGFFAHHTKLRVQRVFLSCCSPTLRRYRPIFARYRPSFLSHTAPLSR